MVKQHIMIVHYALLGIYIYYYFLMYMYSYDT